MYSHTLKNGRSVSKRKKIKFQHAIRWAKGSVHIAVTRQFIDYLLHSEVGKVSTVLIVNDFV